VNTYALLRHPDKYLWWGTVSAGREGWVDMHMAHEFGDDPERIGMHCAIIDAHTGVKPIVEWHTRAPQRDWAGERNTPEWQAMNNRFSGFGS